MVLENMVMAVMKTHALKTWNLFHEDNGNLTFRLKFEHVQELPIVQDSEVSRSDSQGTISFKKKNSKQISRDKARSRKRRRVRQSTSSIETNREQLSSHTDSQLDTLDIRSPFRPQIEENEETFESTNLSFAVNAPPVLEVSEPDYSVALVDMEEAIIEIPPKPEFTVNEDNVNDDKAKESDAEDSESYTSASDFSSDDSGDSLTAKLEEIIKKAIREAKSCAETVSLDREDT